jgi:hypothetical protein
MVPSGVPVVEYRRSDGSWTTDRSARQTVSKSSVTDILRRIGSSVPLGYYHATVEHESGYSWNVRRTEDSGFQSWGLFQVGSSGFAEAGLTGIDPLLPVVNAQAAVYITERDRARLRQLIGLAPGAPDHRDMGAYLSIAYNQGLGAALETVGQYGMDWAAYKARNCATVKPGFNGPAICERGDDCLYDPLTGAPLVSSKFGAGVAVASVLLLGVGVLLVGRSHW